MKHVFLAAAAAMLSVGSAHAAPVVDGTFNAAEYAGAVVTNVQRQAGINPAAQPPSSPGVYVENSDYTVYYTSDSTNVYVGLTTSAPSGLPFTNLYFDTNNATASGSDIGFEVLNNRIFVPATGTVSASSIAALGGVFASATTTGDVIEFSVPWTVFMTNATGLGQPLVAPGGSLQLRTSQSFNYASATGDGLAGDAAPRFGFQFAPTAAVPEPASWALMILGFGSIGFAMRRRAKVSTAVRFA